jgi:bifunctional non-homologous end joining protein LigD
VLETYARKRNFGRTPEPAPLATPPATSGPLRFVVQKHAARRLHYDLRLETDGVLLSWAVPKGPSLDPKEKRLAVHVEDHPIEYAGFEGQIPRGEYGAGEVIVWDVGTFVPDEPKGVDLQDRDAAQAAVREGLQKGKISVTFFGQKLHGSYALVRIKSREGGEGKDWLLIKHADEYADPTRDLLTDDRSVVSGATLADVKAGRTPEPEADVVRADQLTGARAAPFPTAMQPMLPTLTSEPFSSADWVFEPKLDGIRAISLIREESVRILTRLGNDATRSYPSIVEDLRQYGRGLVLDGEIVAPDERGVPSFHRLQERLHLARPADIQRAEANIPVVYYVFDVLYADGFDLCRVPLHERRRLLESTLRQSEKVRLMDSFERDGETLYAAFCGYGLEGMVAKKRDSLYEPGRRTRAWLKIKKDQSEEFIVVGFTAGAGARASTFGALILATHDEDGRLKFVGQVGSGFDDRTLKDLRKRLDAMVVETCPLPTLPQLKSTPYSRGASAATWVRPEMVVEVKFTEWTDDEHLRAPVFLGVRDDKTPAEVGQTLVVPLAAVKEAAPVYASETSGQVNEVGDEIESLIAALADNKDTADLVVEGNRIKLNHLNKVLWPPTEEHPGISKRDFVRYLLGVAGVMLPHLKDRPLTLVRCPDGLVGQRFYQKHIDLGTPAFVEKVRLFSEHNIGDGDYILCNNLSTLVWLGQIAALELHPWYSRINPEPDGHGLGTHFAGSIENIDASLLNYPDFVVFDLDPYIYSGREKQGDEPELNREAYLKTCEVAIQLKAILDSLNLSSFVKTTGRTGLHVFVPILRQIDYDTARAACETIGRFLLSQHPREITMEWNTQKRTGKIFFDHNQNVRGKTLAAAFSPRLSPEGSISLPVRWDEIPNIYPTDFTILNGIDVVRERGDPWAQILDAKSDIKTLLGMVGQG